MSSSGGGRAEQIAEMWETAMRKGYTKLVILTLLSKKPLTGYDIMKKIKEETLGVWTLTAGGVYPILKELEENRYIKGKWRSEGKRKKKNYEITDEGKQLLEVALKKQQQMAEAISNLFREFAHDMLETKLPPSPKPFALLPFGKSLEDKPVDEQIRTLKHGRTHLQTVIKQIEKRLDKLERQSKTGKK
ncbi:MAG: PadR family transcriptional regulator [Thaumarchaeota archaeon]|nr:PadR family transcriptional regulator [Nitrososphaerota archaeon]MCL5317654.1 PadR family transcriptional regulator [Nitrososphaerota archaeon]